ncbi:HpcH/HpaI aldolase family protein [Aestuariivirga sp.]|uniref:HpcH/HpaI aldolase family protein n=1 Tax=Aestuariivirga sp. TaxID=2650926 RepID=UPI0039E61DE1
MQFQRVRELWSSGKPVINGWLSTSSSFVAEIMAAQGYDSVTIDLQHGFVGYEQATAMLQAMRASNVTPMVRVPWLDPADIMKALDAGAFGIICPMINNAEEAARFASYLRYPPQGVRSFGPTRVSIAAGADYGKTANEQVFGLAMIETAEAMKNLKSIVKTPGIDGVYIGPADLTLGLTGRKYPTGFDREEPEMVGAIKTILKEAHNAGIKAAIHCGTPAYAAKAIGWGFDFVTISNDVRLLAGAAQQSVSAVRALLGEQAAVAPAPAKSGY